MKTKHEKLSDQLRRLVHDSGLGQRELARLIGVDVSALSRFLAGERGCSTRLLDKLGEHFNLRLVQERKAK
jgi:transcriptional regulator with XRE-family HTH domain